MFNCSTTVDSAASSVVPTNVIIYQFNPTIKNNNNKSDSSSINNQRELLLLENNNSNNNDNNLVSRKSDLSSSFSSSVSSSFSSSTSSSSMNKTCNEQICIPMLELSEKNTDNSNNNQSSNNNKKRRKRLTKNVVCKIKSNKVITIQLKCLHKNCELLFESKQKQDEHMSTVHGIEPFRCFLQDCQKSFESQ